jgi:four helix bundle protein
MEIKNFYDLDVWKKGNNLVVKIYLITKHFPKEEVYGITSQLRRATCSITANIAEGFARYHFKDKARFYHQARGSAAEVQNFLLLARDLKYLNNESCTLFVNDLHEIMRMINGMLKSIDNQKNNY